MNNISSNIIEKDNYYNDIETVLLTFKDLISSGDRVYEEIENEDTKRTYYKKSCGDLLKIKNLNRQIYLTLEEKRSEIETRKSIVDKMKLNYENLLYKQAYLQREIRACKDLATPNLTEIEKELGQELATHQYSNNLSDVNTKALELLEKERISRTESEIILVNLKETRNIALKKLDKKRKFLDELPGKIETINELAKDLEIQFHKNKQH